MLDKYLAELYEVKALRLREQVKRKMERFPENFMFRLIQEETDFMVSQNAIPSRQHLGGHLPYVYKEHGVLMDKPMALTISGRCKQTTLFH